MSRSSSPSGKTELTLSVYQQMVAGALYAIRKDLTPVSLAALSKRGMVREAYLKRKNPMDVAVKLARKEPLRQERLEKPNEQT